MKPSLDLHNSGGGRDEEGDEGNENHPLPLDGYRCRRRISLPPYFMSRGIHGQSKIVL